MKTSSQGNTQPSAAPWGGGAGRWWTEVFVPDTACGGRGHGLDTGDRAGGARCSVAGWPWLRGSLLLGGAPPSWDPSFLPWQAAVGMTLEVASPSCPLPSVLSHSLMRSMVVFSHPQDTHSHGHYPRLTISKAWAQPGLGPEAASPAHCSRLQRRGQALAPAGSLSPWALAQPCLSGRCPRAKHLSRGWGWGWGWGSESEAFPLLGRPGVFCESPFGNCKATPHVITSCVALDIAKHSVQTQPCR